MSRLDLEVVAEDGINKTTTRLASVSEKMFGVI